MRAIVCGASHPKHFKIGAKLIMWWEETTASHVYFYIKRASGVHLLYQAVGSGTEFMGYAKFKEINTPIYEKEIEIEDERFQGLLDYLIPRLKLKYSRKHLAGLFIKRAAYYIFRAKIKNCFADKDAAQVCVEALCKMLNNQSIYTSAENPEDMGMQEAMQMLRTMQGKQLI